MWRKYFKIEGIKPGVVVYPRPFGNVDFRDKDLDIKMLRAIVEDDRNLPYLHFTKEGEDYFYPDKKEKESESVILSLSKSEQETGQSNHW